MENFIELNRTFYELATDYSQSKENDEIDIGEALGLRVGSTLNWDKLLTEFRVVLLAEAGAGKTDEIRQASKKMKAKGHPAFFLRLEHIAENLEGSFEEGTYEEFQSWLNSSDEGWIFLDSVDEARLKDPKDFQNAIKKLAAQISTAIQRTHIVITSRVTAWRPKTDLMLCNSKFPFSQPEEIIKEEVIDDEDEDEDDFSLESEIADQTIEIKGKDKKSGFRIYSLTDLSSDQILTFAQERKISNPSKFMDEIERQDAWVYTTRPQDLEEIVQFWNDHSRIGSRLELMKNSVERRLKERDEDRAEYRPLSIEKAREGVRLLAASSTLMQESTIRVPDGTDNTKGIDAKAILSDWNDKECQTLLNRPIFDEAIYGTARFHHRSVREYLTAEWFFEILKNDISRKKIEDLFFCKQYGVDIIIPSMKPILSWLVLFDTKIRHKVYKLEPEIILEGGDPSILALETKEEILSSVCQKIALGTSSRSVDDRAAVKRFAAPDLAKSIKGLLTKYQEHTDVVSYLLRLVWQGKIKECLAEAKIFALTVHQDKYTRIAAIRAVKDIGSSEDFKEILTSFLSDQKAHERRLIAELVDNLEPNKASIDWIIAVLPKTQAREKYSAEGLTYSLARFVERCEPSDAAILVRGLYKFLIDPPVIERRFCEISQKYGWLMNVSAKAVEKLILAKNKAALEPESLFTLVQMPAFHDYDDFGSRTIENSIPKYIAEWKELNHVLFWENVHQTRKNLNKKNNESLTYFWQTSLFGRYWSFDKTDFELIKGDVQNRKLIDDKLVALTLAFQLYKENQRPKKWLTELKKTTSDSDDLNKRLNELLHPPAQSPEMRRLKEQGYRWKLQDKAREKKRKEDKAQSLEWLDKNYEQLRKNVLGEGIISQPQSHMYYKMRKLNKNSSSRWTAGNWQDLKQEYGDKVALALRDGLVDFWRTYTPELRSENDDEKDNTPFSIIFGLSGIEIESKETSNWPDVLTEAEAQLVCRYAFHELNSFPNWFPKIYNSFPDVISNLVLNEIKWELRTEDEKHTKHYILSKISYDCEWMWNKLSRSLFKELENYEPINLENLSRVLRIIQNSDDVSDTELEILASKKCKTLNSPDNAAHWFATWIGINPETAIENFSSYLNEIQDFEVAKNLAMRVVVNLVGTRRKESNARETFKTPKHLKNLYLLMHKYIRVEDDIDRAGKGAFSPELRDNAQDARSGIFSILKDIAGKESYLALIELAQTHPVEEHRIYMAYNAKQRAETDADLPAWGNNKFDEFSKSLESTPTYPVELFNLAVQRLMDLKHDLEESDNSNASILMEIKEEPKIRNYIAGWCRDRSKGRYSVPQEEEFADAKRSDIRFLGAGFDCAIPIELKLADNNWGGPKLFERLKNQLCGDYLRDNRSNYGIFLLVYRGDQTSWKLPNGKEKVNFSELIEELQNYWEEISAQYPNIEKITVIGIDLTKRIKTSQQLKKIA